MKIAFFHELHGGGARRGANEFAKQLKKNNRVDLYFVDQKTEEKESIFYSEIFLYKFVPKSWRGNNIKIRIYKDTVELYKLYILHKKIAKDIDKKKYDLVFINPSRFTQAPFILRFLKTKKIYYSQEVLRNVYESSFKENLSMNFIKLLYENLNKFIRKTIDRKNIFSADLILTNSNFTKENILKFYNLSSKVIYLGVDINIFKPIKQRKTYDLIFIGSKNYIDGYEFLKKIISKRKTGFKIFVYSPTEDWIEDELLNKIYSQSKIALSLAINEPFGLIPLEAMACGLPVIAVNEGGYKESIISNQTGYLLPRREDDFIDIIQKTLANNKLLRKMSLQARSYVVDQWSWEKRGHALEILLKEESKDGI